MPALAEPNAYSNDDRWIVCGLGNPGSDYARTRHNAGYVVIDELVERTGSRLKSHKSGCLVAETNLGGHKITLARTTSYMNESGLAIGQIVRFYKASVQRLVVVHDEIDLPFGEIRIKKGGGTAGHNGLKSIVNHLSSNDFVRVRVGVGRPRGARGAVGHVLDTFSAAERKELPWLVDEAADAVVMIVDKGLERAMNEVNTRDKDGVR
jgi:PTH1 family peptidyl-tRNA hydrolase